MPTRMNLRAPKLQKLTLSKETILCLSLDETDLAFGGGKTVKTVKKPIPMTLGPTCDPPSQPANCPTASCDAACKLTGGKNVCQI